MSKTLRVLNAVRNTEIGIPLSIQQYKVQGLQTLQVKQAPVVFQFLSFVLPSFDMKKDKIH